MAALGNVVLVKMNYRLGAFGFLNANDHEVPGNMGIHDQILALNWVRQNIHTFGGNPDKITAFGSSAGAMSIGLLVKPFPFWVETCGRQSRKGRHI